MLSALGCALLLIGCVSDIFDLTFSCAASLIIVFAVIELKGPYPLLIYLVTGLVSLLILPVKFLAIIYLLFSGIYPVIKSKLEEKVKITWLLWLCKLVYFNAVLTIVILAARYFLLLEQGEIVVLSLYGMGNATFVLFDILLSKLITLYIRRFRAKLKIRRFLK